MVQPPKDLRLFTSLLEIVTALRGPDGCPWDKEQTHRSLTPFAIEEAHELAEAIEAGDEREMISELGDLLLQVVLHAEIGRQAGRFAIADVIEAISEKMVRRHPHVFADTQVSDSAEVLKNWHAIKADEKAAKAHVPDQQRFDVPVSMAALARAEKIGAKTKRERFDWHSWQEVLRKVDEELAELKDALKGNDRQHQEAELGDLLFSVAQLARHLHIDAEQALRTTNQRFEQRFFLMKKLASEDGKDFQTLSEAELEAYWVKAKATVASRG